MNKLFFLVLAAAPIFTACNAGWSDKDKEKVVSNCMEGFNEGIQGNFDIPNEKLDPLSRKVCECGLEKAMEKFPKSKDMKSEADFQVMLEGCVEELKITDELVKLIEEQNAE
jgi:hypothetical protein